MNRLINKSKVGSTDRELDQQIISWTNRLTDQKLHVHLLKVKFKHNFDVIQMQSICTLDALQMLIQMQCSFYLNAIQMQFIFNSAPIQMQSICNTDAIQMDSDVIQMQLRCNRDAIEMYSYSFILLSYFYGQGWGGVGGVVGEMGNKAISSFN